MVRSLVMMDMKTVLTHNEDCPVREIGKGLVIECPEAKETHSIEDIGAFIWNKIDGKNDLGTILDEILQEYEVATSTATQDLQTFISQLMEAGLVLPVE
jgi:hypothetical protein